MSVANGLSWRKEDPTVQVPVVITAEHRAIVRKALRTIKGIVVTSLGSEDDVEAFQLVGESLGWETETDSDEEGLTVLFFKGRKVRSIELPVPGK